MNALDLVTTEQYYDLLRNDFASFLVEMFRQLHPSGNFVWGDYIDLLAATLEDCRLGKSKRQIINISPRTLKSFAASVAFPAWLLGHDPAVQIIVASYNQHLADTHAHDCRKLMMTPLYRELFPATQLSPTRQSLNHFTTTEGGFRLAASVGGGITGHGADVIILDDVMTPDDANSDTRRQSANKWYFDTMHSRLNNKESGIIIVVMQRLHQQDLVGELLDGGRWGVLSLPAIAIQDECYEYKSLGGRKKGTFTRKQGHALHPEFESLESLLRSREDIGEYRFQAQYQQMPTSREGNIVKRDWLRFYTPGTISQDYDYVLQSWDTACKTGDRNDYCVCLTWRVSQKKIYLIDRFRARLSYPDLKRAVAEQAAKHRPEEILIEDHASGTALIQELNREGLYGVVPYLPPAGMDKAARLEVQSDKFEKGMIWLPEGAPWLDEYVQEITGFPGAKHDDQVDATTQALDRMSGMDYLFIDYQPIFDPSRCYESC